MASFQAPPGHISQAEVLILCGLTEFQLTVNAPDADLKVYPRLIISSLHLHLTAWGELREEAAAVAADPVPVYSRRAEGAVNCCHCTLR